MHEAALAELEQIIEEMHGALKEAEVEKQELGLKWQACVDERDSKIQELESQIM
jgi:tRNA U54 and U55 pseudouridine synthase Pus10